jgi:hypothetical protein
MELEYMPKTRMFIISGVTDIKEQIVVYDKERRQVMRILEPNKLSPERVNNILGITTFNI